jgi:hypothetical protein
MGNLGRSTRRSKRKPKGTKRAKATGFARELQQEEPDTAMPPSDDESGPLPL